MSTKEERLEELERKLGVYEEAKEYAESLYYALENAEISGLKNMINKVDSIIIKLDEKIEKTEGYIENIDQ